MKECLILPTYLRNHFLWVALKSIRAQDKKLKVFVFSDRGEDNEELRTVVNEFGAHLKVTPRHNYHGNSFSALQALLWAYEHGYDLIHYSEDDVIHHTDCLSWHREVHEQFDDIFCSCGWVFNLHAPITNDLMFAPWYYAPNACFTRDKLGLVVKHANPIYFGDMQKYVLETFPNSMLHKRGQDRNTQFFEQDGLIQFVMEQDKSQVAWCASAKCDHLSAAGYNKPDNPKFEGTLEERIAQVEALAVDPYWRVELSDRRIVEREMGQPLPRRNFRYKIVLPGGWETEYVTETPRERLPRKIHSVVLPKEAEIISL